MKLVNGTIFGCLLFAGGLSVFACGDDEASVDPTPDAGGEASVDGSLPPLATKLTRASHGSTIDISEDDRILVTANQENGSVTVFDVVYPGGGAPPTVTKKAEVAVCKDPVQVLLAPSGVRAFVVCRIDQKVVRIDGLRTEPAKGPEVAVGSEPTGLALTPKGSSAFVANWADGTVTQIDTEAMAARATIDLNKPLVDKKVFGDTFAARPGLAHPRSVAITNNKDDVEDDEVVYVTEFFAQHREALRADGSNADTARQGIVYRFGVKDKVVSTVALSPIDDIGIKDHDNKVAGCFPNQLLSINITGSFAYVSSICASPKGPLGDYTGPAKKVGCTLDAECPGTGPTGGCDTTVLPGGACRGNCDSDATCGVNGGSCDMATFTCRPNFWDVKTLQTAAVHVIDVGNDKVVGTTALNAKFEELFAARNVPAAGARRMPLHLTDIAFVPGTLNAYLPAKGADAVFRVDFNAEYKGTTVDAVGFADKGFIPLDVGTFDAAKRGKLPVGLTIAHAAKVGAPDRFAFVYNDASRNVTVIDMKADTVAGGDNPAVVSAAPLPQSDADKARLEGRRLFMTGLGRWSLNAQAWGACESCHWDGLSDQVTWFHLRGPRQTPSIDQTSNKKDGAMRFRNWTAQADEFEDDEAGALRTVLGGLGAIVKSEELVSSSRIDVAKNGHGGLNGSAAVAADPGSTQPERCVVDDWAKLVMYEKSIRTPAKPSNLDAAKVAAGRAAFSEGKCQGCHGGDLWTIAKRFYTPDPTGALNTALKSESWTAAVSQFPVALLPTVVATEQTMRYGGPTATNAAAFDSMTCMLRPVGTYNVAEPGVGIAELRRTMTTPAQGGGTLPGEVGKGFNVPSLKGAAVNAPYLHAGQARTLEAVLSAPFQGHFAALNPGFLAGADADTDAKRAALVQFLLSIDESTPSIAVPAVGADGGDFCSP